MLAFWLQIGGVATKAMYPKSTVGDDTGPQQLIMSLSLHCTDPCSVVTVEWFF